ncbi:tetratricopeptide repeat protein [Laspinema palackyanum]|uniref:tetratricopeptide repeat protein n=1 Tax=Laspinema palackyanum TaxID=3231601 RepID=UPI00345DA1FE|nr:tetratricopeptide repeat protein [Laspinema sp. D2c]
MRLPCYNSQENYQLATEFYEPALMIRWELNDREGLGNTLHHLGLAYYRLEQYDRAEEYLFAAIEVGEKLYPSLTDDQKISLF